MSSYVEKLMNKSSAEIADKADPNNRIKGAAIDNSVFSVRQGQRPMSAVPWVGPFNRKILDLRQQEFASRAYDRSKPEDREEYSQMIRESYRDRKRAAEVADYRQFELSNAVLATPFALSAFQTINLSDDELPLLVYPRTRMTQRFTVRSIGQDGGARQDQWRTAKSANAYEIGVLSTDKVEYPLIDIQQGNITEVDNLNMELQYDMEMKIDQLALTNIQSMQMNSGLRELLNVHPLIDINNIPDTNYLNFQGTEAGQDGVLTITKLKAILKHIALFGAAGAMGDNNEPMTIKTIFHSPQNIQDSWNFVDLVSVTGDSTDVVHPHQTVPEKVREDIYENGMMTNAWGNRFSFTPNARISLGRMYITTNQPVGWMFTKSEFDQLLVWDGVDQKDKNQGMMQWKRVLSFIFPLLWVHRVTIVDL